MNLRQCDHQRQPALPVLDRVEMDRGAGPRKVSAVLIGLVLGLLAAAADAAACRLAVLGDSLTAGYGVGEAEAFPVLLERALRARGVACEVLNAGVSGDTSAGGVARLEWVLADRPTHLLVELGGNDALRALPVEQLYNNINRIIQTAKARGVEVMLAGMLAPPNLGSAYGEAFKAAYLDLSRLHDIPLYPFFLDGAVLDPKLMQPDGIHPNARGIEVVVERIAPAVAAWLEEE